MKDSQQIVFLPLDLNNPNSPTNDLFKNLVRAFADEILSDLKQSKEPEIKLISRLEASQLLKVCPDSISNYEKLGLIKNYGTGRKKLYNLHELQNCGMIKYKSAS